MQGTCPGTYGTYYTIQYLSTGNSDCRLRWLVYMRTPKLRRAVGLIYRFAVVIARRCRRRLRLRSRCSRCASVHTRRLPNTVLNLHIKVRLTIHDPRRLTPTIGHGKVPDFNITNDTTVGGRNTGNEHTAHPHKIQRSGTAPTNVHD
jgi:hypothetical protein